MLMQAVYRGRKPVAQGFGQEPPPDVDLTKAACPRQNRQIGRAQTAPQMHLNAVTVEIAAKAQHLRQGIEGAVDIAAVQTGREVRHIQFDGKQTILQCLLGGFERRVQRDKEGDVGVFERLLDLLDMADVRFEEQAGAGPLGNTRFAPQINAVNLQAAGALHMVVGRRYAQIEHALMRPTHRRHPFEVGVFYQTMVRGHVDHHPFGPAFDHAFGQSRQVHGFADAEPRQKRRTFKTDGQSGAGPVSQHRNLLAPHWRHACDGSCGLRPGTDTR